MKTLTLIAGVVLAAGLGTIAVIASNDPEAQAMKDARALLDAGDPAGAAEAYRAVARQGGRLANTARVNLGVALQQAGDLDGSVVALEKAVRSGDASILGTAWAQLATTYTRQEAFPEALDAFDQAERAGLEMTPDIWLNRGIAAKQAGRPEIAERAFTAYRAAAGAEARPSVALDLAEILVVQKRYSDARAELDRFIASSSDRAAFETRLASLERALEVLDRPADEAGATEGAMSSDEGAGNR